MNKLLIIGACLLMSACSTLSHDSQLDASVGQRACDDYKAGQLLDVIAADRDGKRLLRVECASGTSLDLYYVRQASAGAQAQR